MVTDVDTRMICARLRVQVQQAMEKQRKKIRKGKSARGAFANLDEELVISTRHKKKSRKSSGDVG